MEQKVTTGEIQQLTFREDDPNIKMNPLARHEGSTVNAVEECGPQRPKQLKDVVTSRRFILEALCEAVMISLDGHKGDSCLMHPGASYDVETCLTAEELLQGMMDKGLFEVCGTRKGD